MSIIDLIAADEAKKTPSDRYAEYEKRLADLQRRLDGRLADLQRSLDGLAAALVRLADRQHGDIRLANRLRRILRDALR